jgi:putative solute:sodium symporter small subunit
MPPSVPHAARPAAYWRSTLRLTLALLATCLCVTFAPSYFARYLSFSFFGWPFSYWMGAQGAPIAYLLLVGYYAWRMHRLDQEHQVSEEQ